MKNLKAWLKGSLVLTLAFSLAACGTILHPERKGQIDGRIDAGVAVLDGVGLLFFIIPGVIAYAVDFSNGTIYLPGTGRRRGASLGLDGLRTVRFDPRRATPEGLSAIVGRRTGYAVDWRDERLRAFKLSRREELPGLFARVTAL